ncbi:TnsA endonuclease N-terminal domain-containing protein [Aeromonas veronii]|uniref:TnsA endonuclease N-terminal domain-containing protein n=1 Tax=Aeromonas veronii TaxID=654 RepID=UPI0031FC627C
MSSKNTVVPFGTRQEAQLCQKSLRQRKDVRVRKPVRPTTGRVVGFYPSTKNNRLVAWESQLEQKACALFEFSADVVSYREQPITIYFESDGQMRRYTPDFELKFHDGSSMYLEVKPFAKLQGDAVKRRLQQVARFWEMHGQQFGVITDIELHHPTLQRNLKLLRAHQRVHVPDEVWLRIGHWFQAIGSVSFEQLVEVLNSPALVYALLSQQALHTDLCSPFSPATVLFFSEGIGHENCLFSYRIAPDFE